MCRIVAARMWICEFCGVSLYEKKAILEHLEQEHGVDPRDVDTGGDNLIEAECFTMRRGCRSQLHVKS